jgi:hypothetical protein
VPDTKEGLEGGLRVALGMGVTELRAAGAKARALGLERFTIESVASRLVDLYRDLGRR